MTYEYYINYYIQLEFVFNVRRNVLSFDGDSEFVSLHFKDYEYSLNY